MESIQQKRGAVIDGLWGFSPVQECDWGDNQILTWRAELDELDPCVYHVLQKAEIMYYYHWWLLSRNALCIDQPSDAGFRVLQILTAQSTS